MKKTAFLLVLMLTICSCSFVIDSDSSEPRSTHIPTVVTGSSVYSTLQGTVWRLNSSSSLQDTYLYIDDGKYSIEHEKKGVSPEKYPASYEYVALGREQPVSSPLSADNTVIFKEDSKDKFIGFHLKSSYVLHSAESTENVAVFITSLQNGTGDTWSLYNY